MTKKVIRTIVLVASVFVILLTLHTISIGLDLASISQENSNSETWRISDVGSLAANNVYEKNMAYREAIYNSPFAYTRWISTANRFVQLIVGFSLIALSGLSCFIWYSYITMKIRRFRKKLNRKRHNHKIRINGQTV